MGSNPTLSASDHGIQHLFGIMNQYFWGLWGLESIFLPFHKGAGSTGTGIGLSIVDKVVRRYGGEMRVYNDGGAGFEFTLPIHSSQEP